MELFIGGQTSLDFWRLVYPTDRTPKATAYISPHAQFAFREDDAWSLAPKWLDDSFLNAGSGKLHILVFDQRHRRRSRSHTTHLWSSPIPEGSFCDLGHGAYVSSPNFTFLQMATELSLTQLIAYGMELCGRYAFDATADRGMKSRQAALTTHSSLAKYLAGAKACRGYANAVRALPSIVDDSASPMETVDEMLLCLPYRHGGYGLPQLAMNVPVELDQHARQIAGRLRCYADMCYPDIRLDIEHHGAYDHDRPESFNSDRARVNGLKAMGYEVIELTGNQVADLYAFEEIARYVAKRRGKRIERYVLGPTPARLTLRDTLFTWNRNNGHAARQARD